MKILLILLAMLFLCALCGKLIVSVISRKSRLSFLCPHIGYAYVLVFFYVFYVFSGSPSLATYSSLILPAAAGGVLYLVRLMQRRREPAAAGREHLPGLPRPGKDFLYPIMVAVLVTVFAIWPYMLCGWGNYWHSGNEDMEDGLRGRDAYLDQRIFDREFDLGKIIGDRSWYDFAKTTGTLARKAHQANSYEEWYAGNAFRFQYSSLAFWSAVFRERYGMDILLEQMLMNLVLMSLGIYYLCRHAFSMPAAAAGVASAASLLNSFYLTTFFAGHMGSLMYGALIPALLYLVLARPKERIPRTATIVYCALLLAAIGYSYPQPLVIIVPPVLGYKLWSCDWFKKPIVGIGEWVCRNKWRMLLGAVAGAIALAVVWAGLWQATEAYRLRQADQYRAWGYTRDWLILPLFLGLIQSPIGGAAFLGAGLGRLAYWSLVGLSGLLAATLAGIYFRYRPALNRGFFLVFGSSWILMYFVFRFAIVDSYYLYKFLYTHQFLLAIGIVGYLAGARSRVIQTICMLVMAANLIADAATAADIYQRAYNHESKELAELYKIDPDLWRKCFVDTPGGEGVAIREELKAHGVATSLDPRLAEYFIVPTDHESDITGAQFSNTVERAGTLAIKRAPETNYLMILAWNEPEQASSEPDLRGTVFRWVGSGKNDNLGIYVIRPSLAAAGAGRYLRICMQNGPSAIGTIPIGITAAAKIVLARLVLDGVRCAWIPSEKAVHGPQPLIIRSGVRGRSLMPFDDRILLYRVFAVGWTDQPYDERAMSLFNLDEDITGGDASARQPHPDGGPRVRLGQGWQAYEKYRGESFRWAGQAPEIVLDGSGEGVATVALTLEPGPSHGARPLRLVVEDRDGNQIFKSGEINRRSTLAFNVNYSRAERRVYVLRTNSEHLHVAADPRVLDYRVFKISAH